MDEHVCPTIPIASFKISITKEPSLCYKLRIFAGELRENINHYGNKHERYESEVTTLCQDSLNAVPSEFILSLN